ncbi:nuclear transport factor 2 family protein [Sphingomonas sp. RP10(2022)]|uniref:Nuclear transport factor 2 family protein n=1 Tax=Sphingomonas liriopis TaxID=2949094 RepID=A0A9X2KPG6_9SPHN|nr:nuclear transport factor 2 family protein [Sphingomonas liriopis]MCP3733526.1 nuclear transport factor 2 family protein [Sphingomonas liriopis]
MTDGERAIAMADIAALKARYCRTLDTKDWDGHRAVFAPDLVADFRASAGGDDPAMMTHGAAAYVAKLAAALVDVITVHHCHTPEVRIESSAAATGIWAMEDKLWVGANSALPFAWMHGYGHYHEHYVRIDGTWRIAATRLSRLRVDIGERQRNG